MTFSGKSWPSSISSSLAGGRFFSAYSRSVVRIWSSISVSSLGHETPCRVVPSPVNDPPRRRERGLGSEGSERNGASEFYRNRSGHGNIAGFSFA